MTGNGPNWAQLYAQGRCKDIGVPWNAEEMEALGAGIPALYVRSGVLTVEDYAKAQKADDKGQVPVERLDREALVALARKLKVDFTPDIPTPSLINLIRAKRPARPTVGAKGGKKAGAKKAK